MTGLIFATEEEALPFLQLYERGRFDSLVEGESAHDHQILVCITGIGKIKATLRTERSLRGQKVKRVIHAGTCTALKPELDLGKLIAANQVFEGDRIELAAPTYPRMPLEVPFVGLKQVTLVTQDHISSQTEQTYWQRIADISDMTGYAVAYVTATHGVACHIVKVVTGRPNSQDSQLKKTLHAAHETLAQFLLNEVTRAVP